MGRKRVLSFMSQFSHRDSQTPTPSSSPPHDDVAHLKPDPSDPFVNHGSPAQNPQHSPPASSTSAAGPPSPVRAEEHAAASMNALSSSPSASPHAPQRNSTGARPLSMAQGYQPPLMDVNQDTIPELQPIFTFLNSHANKLYQEGYFLKLDDQNSQGRPNPDRTWTECFAQLVGTVLSLWDAAELDAAGEEGEVLPKFINLTDASIKMIESLPTRSNDEQPLQNILSISTAGRNRYLLHFNSHHSLIQWTAGIRLAMFEHSTLQEAYTGALIAGKGKTLNNINLIMDRARFKTEEWVRVRFGAGVPWRRCWCVISPPDEKEYQKMQKDLKKRSPYDRSHTPILKGDIKFYDSKKEGKKQKKAKPIASLTEAYSAYAIYPQTKSLIDASTLVKVEGNITIHSDPPSSTEGFVFIMPEVHPAVIGFEMLLRFLFPTWDTFGLYGRPGRLVASVLDPRSLMFAMPKHRRYGYLEILDVTGLILTEGSSVWTEQDWRRKLKELTGQRMTAVEEAAKTHGRSSSRGSKRLSVGPGGIAGAGSAKPRVNFADDSGGGSVRSSRSVSVGQPGSRTDSAPPTADRLRVPAASGPGHSRNASDPNLDGPLPLRPLEVRGDDGGRGLSPQGRGPVHELASTPERMSSEDEHRENTPPGRDLENLQRMHTPEPVHAPPAFAHGPSSKPAAKPYHSPELRRANSRLSSTTLAQLAKAGGVAPVYYADENERHGAEGSAGAVDPRGPSVQPHANPGGMTTNTVGSREAITSPVNYYPGQQPQFHMASSQPQSKSPLVQSFGPQSSDPQPGAPETGGPSLYPDPSSISTLPSQDPRRGHPTPSDGPSPPIYDAQNAYHEGQAAGAGPTPPQQASSMPQGCQTPPPPAGRGVPLAALHISPVHRKPLPQAAASLQRRDASPASITSLGSLRDHFIDEAALEQVRPPEVPGPWIQRQGTQRSEASSHYDDASSTASPDYASTRKSSETQRSVEKPRAGILRTVGDVPQKPLPKNTGAATGYDIPAINFGPTINYGAANRPVANAPSPAAQPQLQPAAALLPPAPVRRASNERPGEYGHVRQDSDDTIRRVVPWQPGVVAPGTADRPGAMSPQQFVQQRAAAAATPIYSHQRTPSGNTLAAMRNNTPTPPLKRISSYDKLNAAGGHLRSNSADLLGQRPGSQGAASAFGKASGDVSSYLSAREQEHLAKVTGTPLIHMGANSRPPSGGGLVGAIAAREREKQQMKDGVSSQAVQHAINQRQQIQVQQYLQLQQQQQQQQQQQAQMYGYATPNAAPSMYGGSMAMSAAQMGPGAQAGFQLPPGHGPPQSRPPLGTPQGSSYGQQPGWNSPAENMYAQGAGWKPTPQQGVPQQGVPQQGVQQQQFVGGPQPGLASQPQGQYPPGAARPTTPGSMGRNMMYQGQAF